ncbi:amidophosphoribosyltransferase [Porticoccus sp. W117]|uniref:amidophosphoribosyltransferase n=1 Tax=Porticoccus sp. W117 TaxID=3054777 RepID=UPI002598BAC7|nr:amidophosphoribosyltransferase [Porticoccus sp. W117]MDM3871675.1 amidophosphoribosyltransferase [Porticoccus sp. W117]
MCGIVGIFGNGDVNLELYDALTMLQHRGQDAAGITTCENGLFHQRKDNGLVKDVFHTRHMKHLVGNVGIGHVRYPTAGSSSPALAQPFYVNSPYGICMAHNGNLTNSAQLHEHIFKSDMRHVNTDSDSELLLNVFANELQSQGKLKPGADDIFAAIERLHGRCTGAYAVVGLIANYGLFAFRDPLGIRPLVYGKREGTGGTEYMIASESVALDTMGYELVRSVYPGEALFIDMDGKLHSRQCADNPKLVPCIFEHVYFARPDSMIDDVSVYKCRLRQGEKLAEKILREMPDHDIDVVIPIPDTSRVAAQSIAERLGLKLREGFMKNRYIGRTFIMPGQKQRKKSVRQKLNPNKLEFQGKNVLLVDDSIVRGTTSGEIIQMARDAGASKVYIASAAPEVKFPNVYGIDMPSAEELIAHGRTVEEIAEQIGADKLIYQDLDDLIESAKEGNSDINHFDCSVFNGEYVTGDVDQAYLDALNAARNDNAKDGKGEGPESSDLIGIHNASAAR